MAYQASSIKAQLDRGVRVLYLDLYKIDGDGSLVTVCHHCSVGRDKMNLRFMPGLTVGLRVNPTDA